jgi:Ca-activated chloride channel family protein
MPIFANPFWLLTLLLVLPLVWWWLRQGRGALVYPATGLCRDLPAGRGQWARRVGAGLRAAGLVLLIVALAGPRWPDPGTRLPAHGIAIGMVVDTSGSMAERDFTWAGAPLSRLEAVKKVFRLFVEGGTAPDGESFSGRPNDLIALITFATRPESVCPLTLSHDVLLQLLDREEPRTVPTESRTNIGDALAWALHRLHGAGPRRKVLVLLSDGEHNVDPPALKPRQAAQLAGNLNVPIYVLDAGGEPGKTEKVGGEPGGSAADRLRAQKTMQEISQMTKGKYFQVADSAALVEVVAEIDRLERQQIESFRYRRYYEGFAWFALAAAALWAATLVLENTVWRKVP